MIFRKSQVGLNRNTDQHRIQLLGEFNKDDSSPLENDSIVSMSKSIDYDTRWNDIKRNSIKRKDSKVSYKQFELKCSRQSNRCSRGDSSLLAQKSTNIFEHQLTRTIQRRLPSSIKCLPTILKLLLILILCLNLSRGLFCLKRYVHLNGTIRIANLDRTSTNITTIEAFQSIGPAITEHPNETSNRQQLPHLTQMKSIKLRNNESDGQTSVGSLDDNDLDHRTRRQTNKVIIGTTTEFSSLSPLDYDSDLQNEDDESDRSTNSRYFASSTNPPKEYLSSPQVPQENGTGLSSELEDVAQITPSFVNSLFSHIDKQWKFAEVIVVIVVSAILNLVTIIGNIMVLISFKMDRSLQTVSNYFLLSLALADLLIGLISMPLYTLYLLLNYWPLGPLMCDIWLAIDYLNSNAAVLNMLIISFDRYFSVTRPLTYRAKRTTKHACLMISCAWILSLTIWTPAIFTYPYYWGRTVQGTDKCEIEFVKANTYLTFVTAILAFYIPVIIMIYLYWRIWLETKKRYRDLTTLFLVSGVGAAAPARPARPPPHSTSASQQIPAISGCGSSATTSSTVNLAASSSANFKQSASPSLQSAPGYQRSVPNRKLSPLAPTRRTPSPHESTEKFKSTLMTPGSFYEASTTPISCDSTMSHNEACSRLEQVDAGALLESRANPSCSLLDNNNKAKQIDLSAPVKCRCPSCPRIIKGAGKVRKSSPRIAYPHQHHHHNQQQTPCGLDFDDQDNNCPKCRQLRRHYLQGDDIKKPVECDQQQLAVSCKLCPSKRSALCSCNNNCYTLRRNSSKKRRSSFKGGKELSQRKIKDGGEGGEEEAVAHVVEASGTDEAAKLKRRHHHHNHHNHHHQNHRGHYHQHHKHLHQPNNHKTPGGHSQQDHGQHNSGKHSPQTFQCSPDQEEIGLDKQAKLSLITSSYQMLSNNTKSLSCASILHKVHPTQSGKGAANELAESDQLEMAPEGSAPEASGASHRDNLFKSGRVEMKDTANSPIIFPSSPMSVDIEDEDDKDFETRIVSIGDKFRFESERQVPEVEAENLVSAPNRDMKPKSAHRTTTRLSCRQCELESGSKLPPCCSQALTIHDADCKMCNSNLNKHHLICNKQLISGCQQCLRQAASNKAKEAEEMDQKRLPILSALKESSISNEVVKAEASLQRQPLCSSSNIQDSSRDIMTDSTASRGKKKPKKFSQKLTFSDILVSEQHGNTSKESGKLNIQFAGRNVIEFDGSNYPIDDVHTQAANNQHQQQTMDSFPRRLMNRLKSFICGESEPIGSRRANKPEGFNSMQQVDNRTMLRALCCGSAIKINTNASKKRLSSNGSISNNKNSSSEESETNNNGHRGAHNNHNSTKPSYSSHHPIQPKSERKAAKTLSTLLLVFIVTWLPYNVLVLIKTLSGGEDQVPEKVWNFSYYLCYINSTINPLCYALCNAQFRRTYMRILQCKLSNEHNSTRRLVPLQSSTTWNKDLRTVTVSDTTSNPTTQGSVTTTNNGR